MGLFQLEKGEIMNRLSFLKETAKSHWYQWMEQHFYHLHQHPELSFEEENTIQYIIDVLEKNLGIEAKLHDVNGEIFGKSVSSQAISTSFGQGKKTVILTADFDALPIDEACSFWYHSKTKNVMHACGHDLHTSILLGIAWWLKQNEKILNCRVILLFRPAEELNGASFLIKSEKFLEYIGKDAICLGLHVYPELPAGQIATCSGLINYSAEFLKIEIKSKGGHTSRPKHDISSLSILGNILTELPVQINEQVPEAIIAFGQAHGGSKANIIPETTWCEGTLRSPNIETHQKATLEVETFLKTLENDTVHVQLRNSGIPVIPPVINDHTLVERSKTIAEHFPWIEVLHTECSRGGDDIGWFSHAGYPTHYFRLGTKPDHQEQVNDIHTPNFEASPQALLTGAYFQVYQLIQFMDNEV